MSLWVLSQSQPGFSWVPRCTHWIGCEGGHLERTYDIFELILPHLFFPLGERLSGPCSVHLVFLVSYRPWATAMPLGLETWALACPAHLGVTVVFPVVKAEASQESASVRAPVYIHHFTVTASAQRHGRVSKTAIHCFAQQPVAEGPQRPPLTSQILRS